MMRVLPQLGRVVPPQTVEDLIAYFEWLVSSAPTNIATMGQEERPVKGETVRTFTITVKSICNFMLANWGTENVNKLNKNHFTKETLETIVVVCIHI